MSILKIIGGSSLTACPALLSLSGGIANLPLYANQILHIPISKNNPTILTVNPNCPDAIAFSKPYSTQFMIKTGQTSTLTVNIVLQFPHICTQGKQGILCKTQYFITPTLGITVGTKICLYGNVSCYESVQTTTTSSSVPPRCLPTNATCFSNSVCCSGVCNPSFPSGEGLCS